MVALCPPSFQRNPPLPAPTPHEHVPFPPLFVRSYKSLAIDVKPGSQILCADGSIVMECISTDPAAGTVRARCLNTAVLGWVQRYCV